VVGELAGAEIPRGDVVGVSHVCLLDLKIGLNSYFVKGFLIKIRKFIDFY
jgi:hypothetical protein